ncbi:MAG: four helix bundle protein [Sphingobacteriales bacterium]|mgnify:FL=1|nr:four helix bundle protein [Sphingobacteriales bacterium]OJY92350.1 MAG: four helix bundle protein [Sphingobacteriales bacterium 44-15]
MRDFHKLTIWIKSHQLTLKIYNLTKLFPKEETFGLISQMHRAAYSIPSNIAEGCGRNSNPDFKRFLTISVGSASELEYQLFLSHDLGFIPETLFKELETETIQLRKMIYTLIKKLNE